MDGRSEGEYENPTTTTTTAATELIIIIMKLKWIGSIFVRWIRLRKIHGYIGSLCVRWWWWAPRGCRYDAMPIRATVAVESKTEIANGNLLIVASVLIIICFCFYGFRCVSHKIPGKYMQLWRVHTAQHTTRPTDVCRSLALTQWTDDERNGRESWI